MKMNLKIFNSLSNPVAVQNVNGKDVEIHYMNDTEYLEQFTQRGQFFVWSGDGKTAKLLVEKGFYLEFNKLFSPEANALMLSSHERQVKLRRRLVFGVGIPALILVLAAILVGYYYLVDHTMKILIISAIGFLFIHVFQSVRLEKGNQRIRHEYFRSLEELFGQAEFEEMLINQREYARNFLNLEDDQLVEEEPEVIEETPKVEEEPIVAAPFFEEPTEEEPEVVVEPVVEEIVTEDEPEEIVETVIEDPVVEEEPEVVAEPVVEEPVAEESEVVAEPALAPIEEKDKGEADLSILTVDELKEFARDRRVSGVSGMRKSDLVETLPSEYSELRVVELQALARTIEIPNFSTMRRDELIEAIKAGKPEVVEEVEEKEYVRVQIVNEEDQVDLSVLTVDELKEFAKDRKVSGFSTMRKSELVEALPNQLEELRVVELQALAKEHEIPHFSTMRRVELVEALREGKLVEKTDDIEDLKPEVKLKTPVKEEKKVEPKPVKEEPKQTKVLVEGEADLSILTVEELKEFARDRKVSGAAAMRKTELVEELPSAFNDLRVVELQALARALEIPKARAMRRAELVEAIKAGKPEVVEEVAEVEYVRVQIVNEEDQIDLSVLTVDELKEFAKDRKVSGFSTMRKSELVELLPNQLEKLRVVELQALGREHEIPHFSTMRKSELLEALREGKLVEKTDDMEGEVVEAPKKKEEPKKAPVKVETAEGRIRVVNEDDTVDLSVLTVEELKDFARERKVSGAAAMRKSELVEVLPKELEELRMVELQAFARDHKLPHFSTMRRQELIDELRLGIPIKEEPIIEEDEEEEIFVLNEDGTVNFSLLTTEELKDFARSRKVTGFSTMRKSELVEAMPKNLEDLRVVELQALARVKRVPNFSTMRRQELMEVIK